MAGNGYNHLDSLKDSIYNPSKTDPDGTDDMGEVYNPNKVIKTKKGAIDVGDIMKKHGNVSIDYIVSVAKNGTTKDIEYDHAASLRVGIKSEKETEKGKYIDDGMSL